MTCTTYDNWGIKFRKTFKSLYKNERFTPDDEILEFIENFKFKDELYGKLESIVKAIRSKKENGKH
ncbi:hypothetical protein HNR31_002232 [Anoxybacillus caldiproteolyticus]|uniref:Uncharacterized protein n=1 Tax=Thermaerobacillus caldiproteolyticus TaxID=247480 RepID=A0A7V9Z7L8_9BACL|nr:hypothetical protein [Anoxybacillus caldiproteolyticus]